MEPPFGPNASEDRFIDALRSLKKIRWADVRALLAASFDGWNRQNATRLASSLAFYSLLSVAPLLLVLISIVGLVLGHSAAQQRVPQQVGALIGPAARDAMAAFLHGSRNTAHGIVATVLGLVTLLFSASGVAIELRSALNVIWEVPAPPSSGFAMMKTFIKERLFSFAVVIGVGFLLIVSLVISAWISAFATFSASIIPGEAILFPIGYSCLSFLVITFLFSAVYKVIPDVHLEWRDVLLGGAVTSVLFTIGKFLLGLYLGRASYKSTYGAAASIVVLMAWIYYSAQIFFFGAEFTREFARRHGSQKKKIKQRHAGA
jgi:membrane protein